VPLETCNHGHFAPESKISALPTYQGGPGRHRCAVCSYDLGLSANALGSATTQCLHGSVAPESVISNLPQPAQGGEARHKCVICAFAAGLADRNQAGTASPDEINEETGYSEDARKAVVVNAYERNPEARRRCIEHYGDDCVVCGLSLESRYGPAGRALIHVHHLKPLASVTGTYNVDPIQDLRPVCPNCHAVIHRIDPPYSIDDVREMLRAIGG
jgi:hypothetical protein